MDKQKIIRETVKFVKQTLKNAEGGHDWFHIERVWKTAKHISETEKGDPFVIELGALLHDIADSKFHDGDESIGPKTAADFLRKLNVDEAIISHIKLIIEHISFKKSLEKQPGKKFESIELKIIQDADRLDAIGAIGIARAFNYGGFKNRPLYDPAVKPNLNLDKESYKKSNAPTINHFYEKLLLLKDKMNTETGKNMALERHRFMETFLKQFYDEWEGLK